MSKVDSLYIEVCIFKKINGKILYLVLQRSKNNKIFPGIYQIVTGTIKNNQKAKRMETAFEAALREVYEETKLQPLRIWILPIINSYYVLDKDTINLSPMFAVEVASKAEPIISKEHQSYKWLIYSSTKKYLLWESHKNALKYLNNYLTGKDDWGKFLEIKLQDKNKNISFAKINRISYHLKEK